MSKKDIRKELELTLVKTIEEVLTKRDSEAAKKIRKTTHESSKMVAKKFLKTAKSTTEIKTVPPKKVIKTLPVSSEKVVKIPVKKVLQK